MGHKHSKQKAIIGSAYTCPTCQQTFDSNTPAQEVNEHIINCSHSPTSLSSKELHTALSLPISRKILTTRFLNLEKGTGLKPRKWSSDKRKEAFQWAERSLPMGKWMRIKV